MGLRRGGARAPSAPAPRTLPPSLPASLCVLLRLSVNVLPRNSKGISARQRGGGSRNWRGREPALGTGLRRPATGRDPRARRPAPRAPQRRPAPRAGPASAAAFPERRSSARFRSAGRPKDTRLRAAQSIRVRTPQGHARPGGAGRSMLPDAATGLGLALLAALLCSAPAHGLWCQDCTLTTNSSHCTPKRCQPSDTVCASVRIADPSSSRKDHSVNRMCASSCDFVKRHFFSDYLMGFINSGILKVDVDCCEKDLCNGVSGAGGSPWALAGGLLLSLGPTLLRAGL